MNSVTYQAASKRFIELLMEVCVCTWNMKLLAFCLFLTLDYLPFFLSYIDSTHTTKKAQHFREI